MKLYVNGDSHAAAAEAVNPCVFAKDDSQYFYMGRAPHPANAQVSWAKQLSDVLKTSLYLDAEGASSNDRIIRTTRTWVDNNRIDLAQCLIVIQWSTWERQEWQDSNGDYYQVNASGIDHVPDSLRDRYKEFVANVDWNQCTNHWHEKIWDFHNELTDQKLPHIFFNGNSNFSKIANQKDWGLSYINPYDPSQTFDQILKNNAFETVSPDSWHFGKDAHSFWYRYMLQYIIKNNFV